MKHTRSMTMFILVGAVAAAVALGGAAVANAAEGPPENRGWGTSHEQFSQFTDD